MVFDWGDDRPRRTRISGSEWEALKKLHGNKCKVCGKTEKQVGMLERAHLKAHSRGGTQYVPMCKNCHYKYDHGQLTATEFKKLGITRAQHSRLKPKRKKVSNDWPF
jgi:rubredoxin